MRGMDLVARYLSEVGRYVSPADADLFYHRQLALHLSVIHVGLSWACQEPRDHIWWLHLTVMQDARRYFTHRYGAVLLSRMGQAGFEHHPADAGIIIRLLALELRRVLEILGPPAPADRIMVGGSRWWYRAGFIWPVGKPGTWSRPNPQHSPPPDLLRRLLGTMGN